ncbi:aspartic peptidase domain-containing protein [Plectosphaerella cucumerina]|uniref:Aspartic peptidase domain-containing protein n=1 Tax=Plectosphaerella cucumerina TaxID=40658 RepID=A0A8K0TGN3_9PEZI|nr:aspartic peptidase domain-containing protein [Plectosphaerella cucumerina]
MRSAILLVQLSLWVAFSEAFFPWFPDYRCQRDGTCSTSKRAIGDDVRSASFPISQRASPPTTGPQHAAREAERLSAKYLRFRSAATPPSLNRRQNVYRVIEPAKSNQEHGIGIYQDGSDFSYFVRAKLGSEEKELFMLLDTGAATSWVMGSECTSEACGKHNSFGAEDSNSLVVLDDGAFAVNYGTGSVKGNKVQDTINIAGINPSLVFGLANETSNDFNHFPFDGILGLSMASGSSDNFLKKVKALNKFDNNIFCVFISRASDGPNTGEITFGECNKDKYTGDFTYTDVSADSKGDWAIPMDGLSYDGKKAGVKGKLAYIDTGTSYVFGPKADVEAFHKHIPGSSSTDGTTWKIPCDSNKEVTYMFSGQSYVIKTSDWQSKPDASGSCTSNIYGHEVVPNAWLLGDLFLKNVYALFDADEERIGFANRPPVAKVETPEPTSSDDSGAEQTGGTGGQETASTETTTAAGADPSTSENGAAATTTGTPQSSVPQPTSEPTSLITQSTPPSPSGAPPAGADGEEANPSATRDEASQETDPSSLGTHARTPAAVAAAVALIAMSMVFA